MCTISFSGYVSLNIQMAYTHTYSHTYVFTGGASDEELPASLWGDAGDNRFDYWSEDPLSRK